MENIERISEESIEENANNEVSTSIGTILEEVINILSTEQASEENNDAEIEEIVEESLNSIEAPSTGEDTENTQAAEVVEDELFKIGEVSELLNAPKTSRFSSATWYEAIQKMNVLLVGAGGIGSYVGFFLSRLSLENLTVMDDDIIEVQNMSGQLYPYNDISQDKINCLQDFCISYSHYYRMNIVRGKWDKLSYNLSGFSILPNITICGVDNIETRKELFNNWVEVIRLQDDPKSFVFIDGRLAAEYFQVLCVVGDDAYNIARYEKEFIFPKEDITATTCSYKQTSHIAGMIGSVITNLVINFVTNTHCNPVLNRSLPFLTEYDAENIYLNTEH